MAKQRMAAVARVELLISALAVLISDVVSVATSDACAESSMCNCNLSMDSETSQGKPQKYYNLFCFLMKLIFSVQFQCRGEFTAAYGGQIKKLV